MWIPLPLGFTCGSAAGINNLGQVAGTGFNSLPGAYTAFVGTPSGLSVIPPPPGWNTNLGAVAINDSGQVTGSGSSGFIFSQTYIGTTSGGSPIPLPHGWTFSFGYAINNSGQVAGESFQPVSRVHRNRFGKHSHSVPTWPDWRLRVLDK
jgi:hypothetical protein